MLKSDIHMSIFGNIDFLLYGACVTVKKGLETKFPHMEKMGNFFYMIYIPSGNVRQSINFIKNFSHKKYTALGLLFMLKNQKIIISFLWRNFIEKIQKACALLTSKYNCISVDIFFFLWNCCSFLCTSTFKSKYIFL